MKKLIALFLIVILLIGIIGTALASCEHEKWREIDRFSTSTKVNVYKTHGCSKSALPHTHWYIKTTTTRVRICCGCGMIRKKYEVSNGSEHCSLY